MENGQEWRMGHEDMCKSRCTYARISLAVWVTHKGTMGVFLLTDS